MQKTLDITAILTHLELMIMIADKLTETTPYPPSIKKVRDAAERDLNAALEGMEKP